jgi:hypothetical protein
MVCSVRFSQKMVLVTWMPELLYRMAGQSKKMAAERFSLNYLSRHFVCCSVYTCMSQYVFYTFGLDLKAILGMLSSFYLITCCRQLILYCFFFPFFFSCHLWSVVLNYFNHLKLHSLYLFVVYDFKFISSFPDLGLLCIILLGVNVERLDVG